MRRRESSEPALGGHRRRIRGAGSVLEYPITPEDAPPVEQLCLDVDLASGYRPY
jgi:hypothetical protein